MVRRGERRATRVFYLAFVGASCIGECLSGPRANAQVAPATVDAARSAPVSTSEQDEDYAQVVEVRGVGWSSPRGLGDVRIKRELLDASPRQKATEMLSAAPGFFVDHEDADGLGNDVLVRGFDLDHGGGLEMRIGSIPLNIPLHIQGAGYADANFILPEVVRSLRVLQGTYDPRQGDAAIAGSAYFDLGVVERKSLLKASYGSFGQTRLAGVVAPASMDEETFAALAVRKTDGFGQNRASESAAVNAQFGFDLGPRDHARFLGVAYGSHASLAGVLRQDDIRAARVGYYDVYPTPLDQGQGAQTSRVLFGVDFDHAGTGGARFEFAPWVMTTHFRARQNFTGNSLAPGGAPGDLFETTNVETAGGLTSRFHGAPTRIASFAEVIPEPGLALRAGRTDQTRTLLDPASLTPWRRSVALRLDTLDASAYLDLDLRLFKRLRISGGPRADLLLVSTHDGLSGARRAVDGVSLAPRLTADWALSPALSPVVSYGEGFRSLGGETLATMADATQPYSKTRSVEVGFHGQTRQTPVGQYDATLSLFQTWVESELVFDVETGGLEPEGASVRRGLVASFLAKPCEWLLASVASSFTSATFASGVARYVPGVAPIVLRADVAAEGRLGSISGSPATGHVGVGYTFLAGGRLSDTVVGPSSHVLNARASVRYRQIELGLDAYNVLGLRYADNSQLFASNWLRPSQAPTSMTHISAAPPLTVVFSLALHL